MFSSTWTDETIARLIELWATGMPTKEIGRTLGISKNAVVGKAHRLNLEARPSPIMRDGPRFPKPSVGTFGRTSIKSTLPPLRSTPVASVKAAPPPPVQQVIAAPPEPRRVFGPPGECRFPLWGIERPTQAFCCQEAMDGKPYCPAHCAISYTTPGRLNAPSERGGEPPRLPSDLRRSLNGPKVASFVFTD